MIMPRKQSRTVRNTLLSIALAAGTFGAQSLADSHITLAETGDLHGTPVSHASPCSGLPPKQVHAYPADVSAALPVSGEVIPPFPLR